MNHLSDEELMQILKQRLAKKKQNIDENKKLMEQLWQANKKLEESERMKSNFLSNIRNEIINPFASILGLTRNILQTEKGDWDKVHSMAHLIHHEAFSLNFQLKNIFAAAELEAGESQPDYLKVDVLSLIASTVEAFKPFAEKKQIKIKCSESISKNENIYFITDPDKLQLVLSNLLDNAVKFSNATSEIHVSAKIEGTKLIIEIQDFGVGIDKKDLKEIFDRFKQLNSSVNNLNRGHGLGLSVSKALIGLIKGDIDIKTQKGHGSKFIVTLPEGSEESGGFSSEGNEFLFGDEQQF
jgi:signal transduction histidine kinase